MTILSCLSNLRPGDEVFLFNPTTHTSQVIDNIPQADRWGNIWVRAKSSRLQFCIYSRQLGSNVSRIVKAVQ